MKNKVMSSHFSEAEYCERFTIFSNAALVFADKASGAHPWTLFIPGLLKLWVATPNVVAKCNFGVAKCNFGSRN